MVRAVSIQQLPLRCVQGADDHPFGRKRDEIRPEPARLYRVPPNRDSPIEPEDTGTRRHRFQYRDYHDHGKRHESYDGQEIRGNVSADTRTDRERLSRPDETKGVVYGGGHYVWIFANLTSVANVYSASREASILDD